MNKPGPLGVILFLLLGLSVTALYIGIMNTIRYATLIETVEFMEQQQDCQKCNYYVIEKATSGTSYVIGPFESEFMAEKIKEAEISYDLGLDSIYVQQDCDECGREGK